MPITPEIVPVLLLFSVVIVPPLRMPSLPPEIVSVLFSVVIVPRLLIPTLPETTVPLLFSSMMVPALEFEMPK